MLIVFDFRPGQVIDALVNVPEGTSRPKWVQAEAPRIFMAGLMAVDPDLRRRVSWGSPADLAHGPFFVFCKMADFFAGGQLLQEAVFFYFFILACQFFWRQNLTGC